MERMMRAFKKMLREKAEYRAYLALRESLPDDYRFVFQEIEKYLFCQVVDGSVMPVLMNTLESFAIAATDGRPVLSLIGEDAGAFCDNLIKEFNVKTWVGQQRDTLNKRIRGMMAETQGTADCADEYE
jgi:DNA-binding ferritin-like protein (Dps family)